MVSSKATINLQSSVVKSLFLGNILEENLFPFPRLKEAEQEALAMVLDAVDRFLRSEEEHFAEYDRKGEFPKEYLEKLKELGIFGLIIPEGYGGIGLSNAAYARVAEQVARYDGSTAVTMGAHSSIGMKGLLLFGTDAQKGTYLPKLASGEAIAAFCLTEPGSGSDAASIKTTANRNSDGSWSLNGEKLWISNGGIASFYTVFARTESGEKGKLTAFIVERDWSGVSTGPKEDKLGIRASNTTSVIFNNVRVPAECLLGEEGKGFKIAMTILNNGRTGLGGGCVGAIKRCLERAAKQASERKQFGQPISSFELVKEKLASMAVDCFIAESMLQMVAHYVDSGVEDYSVEAAICKVFATEALWRAVNEALQIAGGNGYMKEFPYERALRDARINLIFEGTNEILRLYIALSGFKNAGDSLKAISKAASSVFNDPIKGFGVMSKYVSKRFTELTSLGRERLDLHPALREVATGFELGTVALGRAVEEVLRTHGKSIIGRQLISKRVADVAIDLFGGFCAVARVNSMLQEKSEPQCEQALELLKIFSAQAKRRMKTNLRSLEKSEDPLLVATANRILEQGRYPGDLQ